MHLKQVPDPFLILLNNPKQPTARKKFCLKWNVFKDDYQKILKKLTLFFPFNPVPFGEQSYQRKKGSGTSDQLLLWLKNKFKNIPIQKHSWCLLKASYLIKSFCCRIYYHLKKNISLLAELFERYTCCRFLNNPKFSKGIALIVNISLYERKRLGTFVKGWLTSFELLETVWHAR